MTILIKALADQKAHRATYRERGIYGGFSAEGKGEIVVPDGIVDTCLLIPSFITRRQGKIGDTVRSFVFDVARVIRIRTGEEDDAASTDVADSCPSPHWMKHRSFNRPCGSAM